ncbi:MAG: hypothetical protein ABI847_06965 [Anaerolineales bacterium]
MNVRTPWCLIPEYEALMRLRASAAHRQLVRALGARVERQGLAEVDISGDVEAAQRHVYAERYRNAGTER